MVKSMEGQMDQAMDHRWMKLFIYALVAAIFGMVIYLVVNAVDDNKYEQKYRLTLGFNLLDPPAYPEHPTGTLQAGLEVVRNALILQVNAVDSNIDIPSVDEWKFGLRSVMQTSTGSVPPDYVACYTFPVGFNVVEQGYIAELMKNEESVGDLFKLSSKEEAKWANDVFGNANKVAATGIFGTVGDALNSFAVVK